MDDRSEELRIEAARCLEVAALDRPHSRGELIRLSPVILELAKSEQRRG
jgi:hypothetical protein